MMKHRGLHVNSVNLQITLTAVIFLAIQGCAQLSEKTTVQQFHASIAKKDIDSLRKMSSADFNEKVLRHQNASDDISFLKVPQGKLKVTDIEDISPDKKHVTVEITDDLTRTTKVMYEMVRVPSQNKVHKSDTWVVNELYMRQKKDGVEVTKSLSEQMNLLISIREFLQHWNMGEREAILTSVGPELKELLSEMPPSYLAKVTGKVSKAYQSTTVFRPQADINGQYAVVKLPLRSGVMNLSLAKDNHAWTVQDINIESKDDKERVESLKELAKVVNTAGKFLVQYESTDKEAIKTLTSKEFFEGCISPSDLTMVKLPNNEDGLAVPDVKMEGKRADFTLQSKDETIHISLIQESIDKSPTGYLIDNVTLYDNKNDQRKNLSAMLTSRSVALLVCETLQDRELKLLKQLCTSELNEAVWNRLHQETFNLLPVEQFVPIGEPEILTTNFRGAVTEVTLRLGSQPVVYILRESRGELLLDDIQAATNGNIASKDPELMVKSSFKQDFSGLVPVYEFLMAMNNSNLDRLQEFSSSDFNKRIWSQTKNVPEVGNEVIAHFMTPVNKIQHSPNEILVTLGNDENGAKIHLIKEQGLYQINDAMLTGHNLQGNLAMKQAMRQQITFSNKLPDKIMTVSGQKPAAEPEVLNANHLEAENSEFQQLEPEMKQGTYREPQKMNESPLLQPIPVEP